MSLYYITDVSWRLKNETTKEDDTVLADMGTKEASEKWGVSQNRVQIWCRNNRDKIEEITQDKPGSPYHIPKDYPNPFKK